MSGDAHIHIVDADDKARDSLSLLLCAAGYSVCAHPNARAFVDNFEQREKCCVVADAQMPELSGIELLAAMRARGALTPVIVVAANPNVRLAVEIMKQGAFDFLRKPFSGHAMLASIRAALTRDDVKGPPDARARMIQQRFAALSAREKRLLDGLLKGLPNKFIAYQLGVSVRTVEIHRARLMAKTQAKSIAELVKMALIAL
ncbi:MAG: response regulator [Methylocystis sp.]